MAAKKKRQISFYQNSIPLKHGRKFLVLAMDFFWTMILNVILFALSVLLGSNIPAYKGHISDVSKTRTDLYDLVIKADLDEWDEGGGLLGSEALTRINLKNLVYTSMINYGEEADLNKNIYNGSEKIAKENDNLYQYEVFFKNAHRNDFKEENVQFYTGESFTDYFYNDDIKDYFVKSASYPYLLNEDSAMKIDAYYQNSSYALGKDIYNQLYDHYLMEFNKARNEYTENYIPYIDKISLYTSSVHQTYLYPFVEGLVAFVLSFTVLEIMVPAFDKDGRTISMRMMKNIGYSDVNGYVPQRWQIIVHGLIQGLSYFVSFPISLLFFYSSEGTELLFESFAGFSPIYFGIFSLTFMLLSFVFTYFGQGKNQTIGEKVALLYLKDSREFTVPVKKEEKK